MNQISISKGIYFYTFLCDSIAFEPRKDVATINGGEYDGTVVYGVTGVGSERFIKESIGKRKAKLDGNAFYAEKDGKEIKLKNDIDLIKEWLERWDIHLT